MAATNQLPTQKFMPVKGIINARDLGGYVVEGGWRVRDGVFLRTANLADATNSDIHYLANIPVAKIIDFRLEGEKFEKTDPTIQGAEYVSMPIDASGNVAIELTEREKKRLMRRKKFDVKKVIVLVAFNDKAKRVAKAMYPTLIFDPECQKQFALFFRHILETEQGAILYHCTQGKDRTGIASALILAALGANRETIVADFDATNRVYEADVRKYSRRVRFCGGKEEEVAVVKSFLGANTENFVRVLDDIDQQYGSLESYLKGPIGLTDEDIHTLRERYLVAD